ncbi:MAG: sulfatase-like hydrolase/transferase [Flavobacteriaceae bacterium]
MKLLLPILGFILCMTGSGLYGQARPNFVFILTDDQSYGYMGCTGNNLVQTPHLDQMAEDGILFTKAYITSAICTPSRVSILLSQFERKHGVNFNSGTSVSEEAWANSYPVIMRNKGYYTGWIGKNHAPIGNGGYESGVMEQSFDYWYAGHGHLSFYPKERHEIFKKAKADTQVEIIQEGVVDFLTTNEHKLEGAIQFLEKRPKDQPFMLSLNFNLPHSAGTGSMELRDSDDEIYRSLYRDKTIPLPQNYIAKKDIEQPKLPPELLKAENRQNSYDFVDNPATLRERYIRQLQAMTGIDRLVGQLRQHLKQQNLEDNTVIIFTSDHGLFMGEFGLGGKALCYEKTTHVPLIVMDPGLREDLRGKRNDALVQSIDIAPTILKRAGIPLPSSFQGKDLSGIITGSKKEVRNYVYTENLWSTPFGNPRCEAIQDKDWKYIRYYRNSNVPALSMIEVAQQMGLKPGQMLYGIHDQGMAVYSEYIEAPLKGEPAVYEELYHLAEDPSEQHNLAGQEAHEQKLQELRVVWQRQIKEARGSGFAKVNRYTVESKLEKG